MHSATRASPATAAGRNSSSSSKPSSPPMLTTKSASTAQILRVNSADTAASGANSVTSTATKQQKANNVQEKLKDITEKLAEVRRQRKEADSLRDPSSAQRAANGKKYRSPSPPKKGLFHPKLELIMAEVVHSPYMTKPNEPYKQETFKMHAKLRDFRRTGSKILDLPEDQRPFDVEETKQKFLDEVINFNVSFSMPEDKLPAAIRKSFAVLSPDNASPTGSRQISRTNSTQQLLKREKSAKGGGLRASRSESKDSPSSPDGGFPAIAGPKSSSSGNGSQAKPQHPVKIAMQTVQEDFRDVIMEMVHAEEERDREHNNSQSREAAALTVADAKDTSPRKDAKSSMDAKQQTHTHAQAKGEAKSDAKSVSESKSQRTSPRADVPSSSNRTPRLLPAMSPRTGNTTTEIETTTTTGGNGKKSNAVTPIHALSPIAPLSRQSSQPLQIDDGSNGGGPLSLNLDHIGIAATGLSPLTTNTKTSARRRDDEAKGASADDGGSYYDEDNDFDENDRTLAWKHASTLNDEEKANGPLSSVSPAAASSGAPANRSFPVDVEDNHDNNDDEYEDFHDDEEAELFQPAHANANANTNPHGSRRHSEAKEVDSHGPAVSGNGTVASTVGEEDQEQEDYYEDDTHDHHQQERKESSVVEAVQDDQQGEGDYSADYSADFTELSPVKQPPSSQQQLEGPVVIGEDYYEDDEYERKVHDVIIPKKSKSNNNQDDEDIADYTDDHDHHNHQEEKKQEPSFAEYDEDFD